jgi:hypothetical protein
MKTSSRQPLLPPLPFQSPNETVGLRLKTIPEISRPGRDGQIPGAPNCLEMMAKSRHLGARALLRRNPSAYRMPVPRNSAPTTVPASVTATITRKNVISHCLVSAGSGELPAMRGRIHKLSEKSGAVGSMESRRTALAARGLGGPSGSSHLRDAKSEVSSRTPPLPAEAEGLAPRTSSFTIAVRYFVANPRHRLAIDEYIRRSGDDAAAASGLLPNHRRRPPVDKDIW